MSIKMYTRSCTAKSSSAPEGSNGMFWSYGWMLLALAFALSACNKDDAPEAECISSPLEVVLDYYQDSIQVYTPENAVSPLQFLWQSGEDGRTIVPLGAGNYTVRVGDGRGCFAANTIRVGCANGELVMRDLQERTYSVVQVGEQCWCASNLSTTVNAQGITLQEGNNWAAASSIAFGDQRQGRLYNKLAVDGQVCPPGWRTPTTDDWNVLLSNLGGAQEAALKLRSVLFWDDRNGNNASGFGAVPTGYTLDGASQLEPESANFWSAQGAVYRISPEGGSGVVLNSSPQFTTQGGFTVRCMKMASDPILIPGQEPPVVTTLGVNDIGFASATFRGFVENEGGNVLSSVGFEYWNANTPEDVVRSEINLSNINIDGVFEFGVSGLSMNTPYVFRAFAANAFDESKGNTESFTTSNVNPVFSQVVVNVLGPDSLNITFEGSVLQPSLLVEQAGIVIGRGSDQSEPSLEFNYRQVLQQGASFNGFIASLAPKAPFFIRAFVVVDGEVLYDNEIQSLNLQQLSWTSAQASDIPATVSDGDASYGTVLLNRGKLWLTGGIRSTATSNAVLPIALPETTSPAHVALDDRPVELGLLYNGAAAGEQNVCPQGWRLPSKNEVEDLFSWLAETFEGNGADIAASLRSTSLNGTNETGLNFMQSGFVNAPQGSIVVNYTPLFDFFWTATEVDGTRYVAGIKPGAVVGPSPANQQNAYSIRCIRNR